MEDNREKNGEIYSWFTVVTSIGSTLLCAQQLGCIIFV